MTSERIMDILLKEDEISWQSLILDLVKKENMSPWDIDVSLLAKKYLEMLKTLKEMNFMISGRVVLAAALLLKLKSYRLIGEDIEELDRLLAGEEDNAEGFYDDLEQDMRHDYGSEMVPGSLVPRTPQPRKRKVSIYDLIEALNKAIEVRDRRVMRHERVIEVEIPARQVDIGDLITKTLEKIRVMLAASERLTFSQLVPSGTRHDKVMTLIPLLHLAHVDHGKVELVQKETFGEIEIVLKNA